MNFDGYFFTSGGEPSVAYAQLFRSGAIEFVSREIVWELGIERKLLGAVLEKWSRDCVAVGMKTQQQLGVEPPVAVLFSLMGARGDALEVGAERISVGSRGVPTIDREDVIVPPGIVEKSSDNPSMRSLGLLWTPSGMPPDG